MKIAVVSALGRIEPTGVVGYGGIERAALWLANEYAARGHEVLLFGNVDDGPSQFKWTGVRLATENDTFSPEHLPVLKSCDAVHDWTHAKSLRMARLKNYWATTMWTDAQAYPGRNVYPSEAVRAAFKDPKALVVPIGIPVDGSHTDLPEPDQGWVCFGRITPHKGTDIGLQILRELRSTEPKGDAKPTPMTIAGHVWPGIDEYYAMQIAAGCRASGIGFEAGPPNDRARSLVRGASGLLHLHRWLESFSIVAAEALCYGVPVLTTDQGAPQEWVRATDGGMVVPLKALEPKPHEAPGVGDFFETNWSARRQGIAKRAREMFDIRHVADRYLELYGAK